MAIVASQFGKFAVGNPLADAGKLEGIPSEPKCYIRPTFDGVRLEDWERRIMWDMQEGLQPPSDNEPVLPEESESSSDSDGAEGKRRDDTAHASRSVMPSSAPTLTATLAPMASSISGVTAFAQPRVSRGLAGAQILQASPTLINSLAWPNSWANTAAHMNVTQTSAPAARRRQTNLKIAWTRRAKVWRLGNAQGPDEETLKYFPDIPIMTRRRFQLQPNAPPPLKRSSSSTLDATSRRDGTEPIEKNRPWGEIYTKAESIVKEMVKKWNPALKKSVNEAIENYIKRMKERAKDFSARYQGGGLDLVSSLGIHSLSQHEREALRTYLSYRIVSRRRKPAMAVLSHFLIGNDFVPKKPKNPFADLEEEGDEDEKVNISVSVSDLQEISKFGVRNVAVRLNSKIVEKDELSQSEINRLNAFRYLSNPESRPKKKKEKVKLRKKDEKKIRDPKALLKSRRNAEISKGNWMQSIIWDDTKIPDRPPNTQLILDLNDLNMIFESDLPQTHEDELEENMDDVIGREFVTKKHVGMDVKDSDAEEENEDEEENEGLIEEPPPDLDPFNISNDYSEKYKKRKDDKKDFHEVAVTHSRPAKQLKESWFRHKLSIKELRRFHRPRLTEFYRGGLTSRDGAVAHALKPNTYEPINLYFPPIEVNEKRTVWVKKARQLSASEGRLALFEYIEQYPPLLSNIGMCSHITTFHRKKVVEEEYVPPKPDIGKTQILNVKDDSPFDLGDVTPEKPIQCIQNKMYLAPVFKQDIRSENDITKPQVFLLVRKPASREAQFDQWILRKLPTCYTVGQTQPKMKIVVPFTKKAHELIKDRVRVYVRRQLQREKNRGYEDHLKAASVLQRFQTKLEQNVRLDNVVKDEQKQMEMGDQTNENVLEDLCTPEKVCHYESMAAGYERLRTYGIMEVLAHDDSGRKMNLDSLSKLAKDVKVLTARQNGNLSAVNSDDSKKHPPKPPKGLAIQGVFDSRTIALFIKQEHELAPWALTHTFRLFSNDKKILDKDGVGNPMKSGHGVSYTIDYTDGMAQEEDENEEDREGKALIRQNLEGGVTGKDKDLRALSMKEMARDLEELGMESSAIAGLRRWERVAKLRDLATDRVMNHKDMKWTKYARLNEKSTNQRLRRHKEKVAEIFSTQCDVLAKGGATDVDPDYVQPRDCSLVDQKLRVNRFLADLRDSMEDDNSADDFSSDDDIGVRNSRGMDIENVDTSTNNLGQEKVLIPAIRETRWWYDKKEAKWKHEVVIVKEPRFVEAFKKDLKDGKNRLRDECAHFRDNCGRPPCYFDWTVSTGNVARRNQRSLHATTKKCGRCGQLGHMKTSRMCPYFELDRAGSGSSSNVVKIKVKNLKAGASKQKREMKQKRHSTPASSPSSASIRSKKKVRTRGNPYIRLTSILVPIVKALKVSAKKNPYGVYLEQRIDLTRFPDYTMKVQTVMDLTAIDTNIKEKKYDSGKRFLDDVSLLYTNSRAYNGENNQITLIAKELVEQAERALKDSQEDLADVEESIKRYHMVDGMIKVIRTMEEAQRNTKWFQSPISKTDLKYHNKISDPMDLQTLEKLVKAQKFMRPEDFWSTAELIASNAATFHGKDSPIAKEARRMLEAGRTRARVVLDNLKIPQPRITISNPKKRKRTGD